MAHVRRRGRRKDGTWRWEARIPAPSRLGGTHKIERTFRTKQEAEDWIASQRVSILQGSYIDARQGERPFADLVAAWRESWPHRLSPTTQRRYESIIDKYL